MNKQQIKDMIQEAWNEGKGRQPDTFGTFLDAAADKILASLPQDKAPVLTNEIRSQIIDDFYHHKLHGKSVHEYIATAQRDADHEYYRGR